MSQTNSSDSENPSAAKNPLAGEEIPLEIYRSSRHELMYVYLPARAEVETPSADLSVLPEALLQRFGSPVYTLSLDLTPERKLAAADATQVLAAIKEQGFYLQMPPTLNVERTTQTPDARNPHEGR